MHICVCDASGKPSAPLSPVPTQPTSPLPVKDMKDNKAVTKPSEGKDDTKLAIKPSNPWYKQIKILDLLRYISTLSYELVNPKSLGTEPDDFMKKLLKIVWPSLTGTREQTQGRNELISMWGLSFIRTVLLHKSSQIVSRLMNAVYNSKTGGQGV